MSTIRIDTNAVVAEGLAMSQTPGTIHRKAAALDQVDECLALFDRALDEGLDVGGEG